MPTSSVTETSSAQRSEGLVVTLEGTNLFLTVIISTIFLLGILIKLTSQFNKIANDIKDIREDLISHSKAEGHEKTSLEVRQTQKDFIVIANEIKDIREGLISHSKMEGHEKISLEVKQNQKDLIAYDKKLDLHLVDYVHYKDANLLVYKGLGENITHIWLKTEKLIIKQETDIKELQRFLQKQKDFKIRE